MMTDRPSLSTDDLLTLRNAGRIVRTEVLGGDLGNPPQIRVEYIPADPSEVHVAESAYLAEGEPVPSLWLAWSATSEAQRELAYEHQDGWRERPPSAIRFATHEPAVGIYCVVGEGEGAQLSDEEVAVLAELIGLVDPQDPARGSVSP